MQITKVDTGEHSIAIVSGSEVAITDVQTALDLMATVDYETGTNRIVIHKSLVSESFFDLSTKIAGDILQKFVNYRVKAAFVGDFSGYESKSLKDFIYECNKGNDFFFLPSEQLAIEKLSGIK